MKVYIYSSWAIQRGTHPSAPELQRRRWPGMINTAQPDLQPMMLVRLLARLLLELPSVRESHPHRQLWCTHGFTLYATLQEELAGKISDLESAHMIYIYYSMNEHLSICTLVWWYMLKFVFAD